MKILKIISLLVLSFYMISTLLVSFKDGEKNIRITCFILFLLTLVPFYYVYVW